MSKIVDFIYAAEKESDACEYLVQQFSKAFGIPKAKIYIANPVRSHLRLVGQVGFEHNEAPHISLEESNRNEVNTYFSKVYFRYRNNLGEQVTLIPLMRAEGVRLGVVALYGFEADPQSYAFLELLAYLKQSGSAVGSVIDRERKLLQLKILNDTGMRVSSSLDLKHAMQETVDAAVDGVPGAQRGVLFVWNEGKKKLFIEAIRNFDEKIKHEIFLNEGEGYAGLVYMTGESLRIRNAAEHPIVRFRNHPEIKKQKSVMCVALKRWGRVIGVLCVDNTSAADIFQQSDEAFLEMFAAQAAIAFQNSQLYNELYNLGIRINSGNQEIKQIFQQTVQSITGVSKAKGAHMLLLRDVDDSNTSLSEQTLQSESVGLGDDYDEKQRPRPEGLTHIVLNSGEYRAVSSPDDAPGINPLAQKQGIKACIGLPMKIKNRIIGVLFVCYNEKHSFTQFEIEPLSLFARQAALAIENTMQRKKLDIIESVAKRLDIIEAVVWMGIEFSDLAHEIGQQAGAIRNVVHSLKDRPDTKDATSDIIKFVKNIEEILRKTLPPFREERERIELNELLSSNVKEWCAPETKIETDFDGLAPGVTVYADKRRLETLFKILTTNAVRAARSSPERRLLIDSKIISGRVVVNITNTGKPIPSDLKERLFKEPIGKAQGAEGTGVGLLIARSILLMYEGDIKLVKSDSEGTTFSFELPLLIPET